MQVSEFMTKNVKTIKSDCTVEEAAKIMADGGFSVLPVVDNEDKLVGIMTESDFAGKEVRIPHALGSIKQLFGQNFYFGDVEEIYKKAKTKKVSEVMSKNVKTVTLNSSLTDVIDFMINKNLKRLPVVDGNKLVGIITRKDLLKAFNKI